MKFLGIENLKTKFGLIECMKLNPYMEAGRVFRSNKGLELWVTNDKNRSEGIFYVSQAVEEKDGFFSFFSRRSNNNDKTNFKDSDFQVKITKKNNKTYVRAYSKDGKIEEAEKLISKINESLS